MQVLRKQLNVLLNTTDMYDRKTTELLSQHSESSKASFHSYAWTRNSKRLFTLLHRALANEESVLLVGDTGTGKTRACQLYADMSNKRMHLINCHQQTETSDFIGGYRPRRTSSTGQNHGSSLAPFVWEDGPLVRAMKDGDVLLVDELSLADDSVIERLNSVLDNKTIALTEKGGRELEVVEAAKGFLLVATMNPSGDFGKKELSPALRNRFTECYVPQISTREEVESILQTRLHQSISNDIIDIIGDVWDYASSLSLETSSMLGRLALSIRDIISWADFVTVLTNIGTLNAYKALVHGAYFVFLDGLGIGTPSSKYAAQSFQSGCEELLRSRMPQHANYVDIAALRTESTPSPGLATDCHAFGASPFFVDLASTSSEHHGARYQFSAPATARNTMRVLRAMQLRKPLMIEGLPGVGKTSLIDAIAKATGNSLVRINLSQQTDMMDLIGADVPSETNDDAKFKWCDGPLLRAIKSGWWVLLDEINLASQSVLEGLNSMLDHRGELFIPELAQTFQCGASFRVFAAQNPASEGSGRKGLPQSFLNRFAKVHIEPLKAVDQQVILSELYPSIPQALLSLIISTINALQDATEKGTLGVDGKPWELNLRDAHRWCELLERDQSLQAAPVSFINAVQRTFSPIFLQRFRNDRDRLVAARIFAEQGSAYEISVNDIMHVPAKLEYVETRSAWFDNALFVGNALVTQQRKQHSGKASPEGGSALLMQWMSQLQAVAHCIQEGWPSIIVGPSGSGKTTLVRQLANMTGNKMHELSLTASSDTSELLGSYEQAEPSRKRRALEEETRSLVLDTAKRIATSNIQTVHTEAHDQPPLAETTRLTSALGEYEEMVQNEADVRNIKAKLLGVLQILSQYIDVSHLQHRVEHTNSSAWSNVVGSDGFFQWVDGLLLRAAEKGEWLLLENANLCSPSVLDRLNPLLEPDGQMLVNESGLRHGQSRIVKAHPSFRLLLTMDPSSGSLSRAMRNRGVEVAMPTRASKDSLLSVALARSRLPPQTLPENIAHLFASGSRNPTVREGSEATSKVLTLLERGISGRHVLQEISNDYGLGVVENQRLVGTQTFQSLFSELEFPESYCLEELCSNSGWNLVRRVAHPLLTFLQNAVVSALEVSMSDDVRERTTRTWQVSNDSAFFGLMLPLRDIEHQMKVQLPTYSGPDKYLTSCNEEELLLHSARVLVSDAWVYKYKECLHVFIQDIMQRAEAAFGALCGSRFKLYCKAAGYIPSCAKSIWHSEFPSSLGWYRRSIASKAAEGFALMEQVQEMIRIEGAQREPSFLESALQREMSQDEQIKRKPIEVSIDSLPTLLRASLWFEAAVVNEQDSHEVAELQCLRHWLLLQSLVQPRSTSYERNISQGRRQLLVPWLSLRRQIYALSKPPASCGKEYEALLTASMHIDQCYGLHEGNAQLDVAALDLWGKPSIPQDGRIQERLLQLENLADKCLTYDCSLDNTLSLRHRCVEITSALSLPGSEAASLDDMDQTISLLQERIAQSGSASTHKDSAFHLEPMPSVSQRLCAFTPYEVQWPECRSMQKSLHELNNQHAIESHLKICHLAQCWLENSLEEEGSFEVLREMSQRALEESIYNTDRRPSQIAPLMQLLWLLDSKLEDVQHKYSVDVIHNLQYALLCSMQNLCEGSSSLRKSPHPIVDIVSPKEAVTVKMRSAKQKQLQLAARSLQKQIVEHVSTQWTSVNSSMLLCSRLKTMLCILALQYVHDEEKQRAVLSELSRLQVGTDVDQNELKPLFDLHDEGVTKQLLALLLQRLACTATDAHDTGVSESWCLLGLWRIHMCMPQTATDPMVHHKDKADRLSNYASSDLHVEYAMISRRASALLENSNDSERMSWIAQMQSTAEREAAASRAHIVDRPHSPTFIDLKREVRRAFNGLLNQEKVIALVSRISTAEGYNEAQAWRESALDWLEALSSRFARMRDVAQPVLLGIREALHGIDLALQRENSTVVSKRPQSLVHFPQTLDEPICTGMFAGSNSNETSLQHLALALRRLVVQADMDTCQAEHLMREASNWWAQLHVARDERANEANSLFRTRVSEQKKTPENEKEEEEHFAQTFPQMHGRFEDLNQEGREEDDVDMENNVMQAEEVDFVHEQQDGTRITPETIERLLLENLIFISARISGEEPMQHEREHLPSKLSVFGEMFDYFIATSDGCYHSCNKLGQLARVCLRFHSLRNQPPSRNSGLNFALRAAPHHVARLTEPVMAIRRRVSSLLGEFEDNPLLQLLQQICERILTIPVDASFKQLLMGIELLLSKARLWEQSAAKHVSLKTELDRCLTLAREWRREEINSWYNILNNVQEQFIQRAKKTWFPLYQLLLSGGFSQTMPSNETMRDLARTLEEYMQSGSTGGFETRVCLLRMFVQLLRVHEQNNESEMAVSHTRAVVENVCLHYSHLLPFVQSFIQQGREPIQKELEEHIRLARWEDRTYAPLDFRLASILVAKDELVCISKHER